MNYNTRRNFWKQNIKKKDYIYAILQAFTMIMVITYLFYHSIWAVFPFSIFIIPYLRLWENQQETKQKNEFQMQFKEFLEALMIALRAGYALENAMVEAKKDMEKQYGKDTRIVEDLITMEYLLGVNIPVEEAWKIWSNKLEVEFLEHFTTVIILAKKSGGDSVAIIKHAIYSICSTLEVEMEIGVILAAKKMEFYIMSVVPLAMIMYMKWSFPEFMAVLYGNVFGGVFMSLCLGLYVIAFAWGNKMTQIEV